MTNQSSLDGIINADDLVEGIKNLNLAISAAYGLLWRDLGVQSIYAQEARKVLRNSLTYQDARQAMDWVKKIYPIQDVHLEDLSERVNSTLPCVNPAKSEECELEIDSSLLSHSETDCPPFITALKNGGTKEEAIFALERMWKEMARPSVLFKPTLMADGDMWCALLGDDLQSGVAGFGVTPAEAMTAFDQAFSKEKTPEANQKWPADNGQFGVGA